MPTCPVCGTEIEENSTGSTYGDEASEYGDEMVSYPRFEHEGEIYRFCCAEHKTEFQKRPEEYV